ncbi:Mo-dependent nitrogenase C-terminal domain-containing protein [Anabaena sp. FACHB-1237]|uniref:Mo-dependent nitrogenase C-terminal domain-containing protein n=1 Tax=Anabaena sp. FACHB-1237 TaxID=2692769 RepID=UPI00168172DB|nr:Mo-dependent nitrogenase C-terminal domain-containing protein [Anabaena sp. FACHB-1237]MBD2139626.1 Mo-dependent nitrogenase C-terminal domain-containing protein [Anabaena sp. FACHB-1237]
MNASENRTRKIFIASWISVHHTPVRETSTDNLQISSYQGKWDILRPLRHWLDSLQVRDRKFAHRVCSLIPAQCPFERDVKLFGRTLFHIPPMCKLNPLYQEVVGLRFRALCYLADECGEDISQYC